MKLLLSHVVWCVTGNVHSVLLVCVIAKSWPPGSGWSIRGLSLRKLTPLSQQTLMAYSAPSWRGYLWDFPHLSWRVHGWLFGERGSVFFQIVASDRLTLLLGWAHFHMYMTAQTGRVGYFLKRTQSWEGLDLRGDGEGVSVGLCCMYMGNS